MEMINYANADSKTPTWVLCKITRLKTCYPELDLAKLKAEARRIVRERWAVITRLAVELMFGRDSLSEEEINEILRPEKTSMVSAMS